MDILSMDNKKFKFLIKFDKKNRDKYIKFVYFKFLMIFLLVIKYYQHYAIIIYSYSSTLLLYILTILFIMNSEQNLHQRLINQSESEPVP